MVHRTVGLRLPATILLGTLALTYLQTLHGGTETALDRARHLYFKSIDDRHCLPEAVAAFDSLAGIERNVLLQTYRGALEALKGKYAIFPITKLTRARHGLSMMDEGIRLDPDNLEIRFIRGCSSYHMPFFMGRKEMAVEDLSVVLQRIPHEFPSYAPLVVERMITFLIGHDIPSQSETESLLHIRSNLEGFLPFGK